MTARQQRFIEAILADPKHRANRAAEAAGYAWPNKQAYRLMTHWEVGPVVKIQLERVQADELAQWQRERQQRKTRLRRSGGHQRPVTSQGTGREVITFDQEQQQWVTTRA